MVRGGLCTRAYQREWEFEKKPNRLGCRAAWLAERETLVVESPVRQSRQKEAVSLRFVDGIRTPSQNVCESGACVVVTMARALLLGDHTDPRGDVYKCAIT